MVELPMSDGLTPNVRLLADGGGEHHHVGHPRVIGAAIKMYLMLRDQVDRLIKTRSYPYSSYLHQVK